MDLIIANLAWVMAAAEGGGGGVSQKTMVIVVALVVGAGLVYWFKGRK